MQYLTITFLLILTFSQAQYIADLVSNQHSIYNWKDEKGTLYTSYSTCNTESFLPITQSAIKKYSWSGSKSISFQANIFFIDIDDSIMNGTFSLAFYANNKYITDVFIKQGFIQQNLCQGSRFDLKIPVKLDFKFKRGFGQDNNDLEIKLVPKVAGKTIVGISNIEIIESKSNRFPIWAMALIPSLCGILFLILIIYAISKCKKRMRKKAEKNTPKSVLYSMTHQNNLYVKPPPKQPENPITIDINTKQKELLPPIQATHIECPFAPIQKNNYPFLDHPKYPQLDGPYPPYGQTNVTTIGKPSVQVNLNF